MKNVTSMLVVDVVIGDAVVVTPGDVRIVEDIYDKPDMDGCWLEYEDGSSMFHIYGTSVNVEVE